MMTEDIKTMFARAYPKRDPWAHKGDFGYVLILAGSEKYSGSPIFNAMGALRAGADVAVLRGHPRAMNIAAAYAPDIITEPFADEFSAEYIDDVLHDMDKYQSIIIGCGMGRGEASFHAIRTLIKKSTIPMVLDAEAIRAIAGHPEILKGKNILLTPNSEEFRVLTSESVGPNEDERKEKVGRWAEVLGVTILLKGNSDVISNGKRTFVNTTGSPFMTKGGFGDVLTGITGAMLARTGNAFESACLAAYINGKAGEATSAKSGEGVLASESFETIPLVIQMMSKDK